jgi:poly-gamma-glutamate capsule biosynthesis protein CapA/YwtB (metallophosphatase superfamily)
MNRSRGSSIESARREAPVRVLIASDWAPIRAFDPLMQTGPESVYGDMLPLLRGADLRIVNCECSLTTASKAVWKSGAVFKGNPSHVKGLTVVPFDVACLANNHVLDYGVSGFRESLNVLHRNGVQTVGAGLTGQEAYEPLSIRVKNRKFHIVNFSEGEDLTSSNGGPGVFGWEIPRALSLIRECRKKGGIVIAIGHCGLEYVPFPPPYVVAAFRAMVEAGADCVIGHHPHVPQGIEWHRQRPIAYSLGNFVFYQQTNLLYRKTGFCVTLEFPAGSGFPRFDLHPYRIGDTGLGMLSPREEVEFRRKIARISTPFQTAAGPARAWQAYLSYYGMSGFTAEVAVILEKMKSEPLKGAAMFRNRITTLQHSELWRDTLTRVIAGERAGYSKADQRIVHEWFTKNTNPSPVGM